MFEKIGSSVRRLCVGSVAAVSTVGLGIATTFPAAAAIDTADITAAKGDVALVGAAVFAVIIAAMIYKWIKKAL